MPLTQWDSVHSHTCMATMPLTQCDSVHNHTCMATKAPPAPAVPNAVLTLCTCAYHLLASQNPSDLRGSWKQCSTVHGSTEQRSTPETGTGIENDSKPPKACSIMQCCGAACRSNKAVQPGCRQAADRVRPGHLHSSKHRAQGTEHQGLCSTWRHRQPLCNVLRPTDALLQPQQH